MAERKAIEDTSSDAVANRARAGNELQAVDSPSAAEPVLGKMPAEPVAATVSETNSSAAVVSEKEAAPAPTPEILAPAPSSLVLRPRHARHAPVAASVAIAAALGAMAVGAVVGAATTGGFSHTVPASATPIPTSRPAAADAETNPLVGAGPKPETGAKPPGVEANTETKSLGAGGKPETGAKPPASARFFFKRILAEGT